MITKYYSRYTYECKDRYIIEPNIHAWDPVRKKNKKIDGIKVKEDFEYSSDNNKDWLKESDLKSLLVSLEKEY